MRNIYVPLPDGAIGQLWELGRREMRDPKAQASALILDGLRALSDRLRVTILTYDPERAP